MSTNSASFSSQLLIALPALDDPNFSRSVALICQHDADGAMGVVVNRPLEVEVAVVLPAWQPYLTSPGVLFQGGPVSLDSALGLVAVPGDDAEPLGVRRIIGSLGLVDLDTPPEVVVAELSGLRIFAGYAGWGEGQLEEEIAEGAWYVVDGEARDAFSGDPEQLWRTILRRQGGDLAMVATYPEDPSLN